MKFLDEIGLAKLWGLITNKFTAKDEKVSIDKLIAGETNTKIPSSLLPSYVDDVLEYDNLSSFPEDGESGKIYVDLNTNKTYRWGGTAYTEISPSLALGTTSSTAYRGDYGAAAYEHANNKGNAFSEGLYKITTNDEGHVTSVSAVQQNDITDLGIATTATATSSSSGLMSAADKAKLDGISEGGSGSSGVSSVNNKTGNVTLNAADVGAVAKTGDTMTGRLVLGNTDPVKLEFLDTTGVDAGFIHISDDIKQIALVEQSNRNEYYRLPAPSTDEGTATANYNILTSKSPVTIAQGGTGATTAADACKNLMIGVNIEPNALELHPTSTNAGHGGYIDFHYNMNESDYTSRIIEDEENYLNINAFDGGKIKLGRVTAGTWQGSAIGIAYGGTGATTAAGALSALGAVNKAGDTMTGNLVLARSDGFGAVEFKDAAQESSGYVRCDVSHRIDLVNNATDTDYAEHYLLPSPSTGLTASKNYNILTTKNVVTVAQGGTGATSARAASVNLLNDNTLNTITTPTSDYNGIFYTTMPNEAVGTGDITAGSLLHVQNSISRGFQIAAQAYGATIKWRGIHSGSTSDAGTTGYKTWYTIYHTGNKPSTSDIGAAPTSHASTATTYGVSSASNYGHAMASSTTPKALGTAAVGSETAKFARGDHVHALPALTSCTGTLTVAKGGTGATSAANARKNLGVPTFTYTSSTKTLALTTT